MDHFAGIGTSDRRPQNATLAICHDLDQPGCLSLGLGAVVFGIGPAQHAQSAMFSCCLGLVQADMRNFRINECHPGNYGSVGPDALPEQDGADHQPGMIAGNMGKLQRSRHVTNGINPAV